MTNYYQVKQLKNFNFEIIAKNQNARAGKFYTPHGVIETPVYAPVGTQAVVKTLTSSQLAETGASLVLSNTYHLYLRPGAELIAEMGGLHHFMHWDKPMLTDSGGFQVFSLSGIRKIDDDGVTFRSHIDGSKHRFTPEIAVEIQEKLGADIIMAFDECASPYDEKYIRVAMERTHAWAERCINAKKRDDQALFGIVQGGIFPEMRKLSAEFISSLDFPGHAIGGLSVGETKTEMYQTIEVVNQILPVEKPRYLMGVGTPEDLVYGVLRGIDIFDCVLATRLARHSSAITYAGRINLMNVKYARDDRPVEPGCTCYTCQTYSKAYIRHLIAAKESLSGTLISIHNIHMLQCLMKDLRNAIIENRIEEFSNHFLSNYEYKPGQTADRIMKG
ncbi:MAG: tRNA guanosine(34) transglycosylase Tgt [Chloroflexi bacterium HGW-Chloroflexi-10]|nr:MAG: tRNA guanosine(34) transglycosylase Tgt [Chloroflexi bacterium HGW-Chloroflexi-10]